MEKVKITREFVDRNTKKLVKKDSIYEGDAERIAQLVESGVAVKLKEVAEEKEDAEEKEEKELTVPQIKELLEEKGIAYDSKAKKPELLALLQGAE